MALKDTTSRFSLDLPQLLLLSTLISLLGYLIGCRYRKGLRNVPGPFFASFLPIDRLRTAISGCQQLAHIEYHKKYGRCVRVGPNHVSFSDASVITQIYGITSKFYKVNNHSLPLPVSQCN